jgi:PAS domain S-box-containing protein
MKRISILATIAIVLLSVFSLAFYYYKFGQIKQEIYLEKSQSLKQNLEELISQKKDRTSEITYILSQDKNLAKALVDHNCSKISYQKIIRGIRSRGEYKNLWINIIDARGYNIYRSWTDKRGEDLKAHHIDIVRMLKERKQINVVSTGRYDIGFKTMSPIFYKGKFIGIIEMISHFNSIADRLKEIGIEPMLLVEDDYSRQIIDPFSKRFIGKNYLANINASEELAKKIEAFGVDRFFSMRRYMLFENYFVTDHKILDMHGQSMGHFLLFVPLDQIDMSRIEQFKIRFLIGLVVLLVVIILAILLLFDRDYVKKLNREVEEKTAIIKTKSEELASLLKVYDKSVIFSQTDLDGVITHVSEAFCQISGYSREELIGANHNIIRHPDMPAEAFRYLWQEIKKERWVRREVKNRKKDGSHYWVIADIGPHYDREGKHIGYNAIRQDITAIKEIAEIQKEIILVLGSIGERRSRETGEHVQRVAVYARILATHCGLSSDEIEMLELASPMHDIGKVAIPDSILNKPGTLTTEEMEMIRTHTIEGYKLLSVSDRPLLKVAATIALEHHERWDGSGYPKGLKGEAISLYARITALADVFDALSFDRCYKKAWSDERIFDLIRKERGRQFDPRLVDIFFAHINEFLDARERKGT